MIEPLNDFASIQGTGPGTVFEKINEMIEAINAIQKRLPLEKPSRNPYDLGDRK